MDEPGMDGTGIDEPGKAPTRSHWLWEIIETVAIALVLAFLIRNFVMESFLVQGTSMYPTLHDGERLLVNKFVYRFRDPEPGEIVVFQYPLNPSRDFIKRVIAGPGDRVRIEEGVVFVNGRPIHETYVYQADKYFMPEQLVPPGHVFVMGDNRMNSEDSRTFGTVSSHLMVGRAFVVYWPPEDMRRVTDGTEVTAPGRGFVVDPGGASSAASERDVSRDARPGDSHLGHSRLGHSRLGHSRLGGFHLEDSHLRDPRPRELPPIRFLPKDPYKELPAGTDGTARSSWDTGFRSAAAFEVPSAMPPAMLSAVPYAGFSVHRGAAGGGIFAGAAMPGIRARMPTVLIASHR